MKEGKVKLITFGRGGFTVYRARVKDSFGWSSSRLSGYADPEDFFSPYHWWADPPDKMVVHLDPELAEGVPVLDTRGAVETPAGFNWVFQGPMVDVDLPDGEVLGCPTPDPLFASAVADNAYGCLLAFQSAHRVASSDPGPLDSVSVGAYIEGWRQHGARVGVCRCGRIEWKE